MGQKKFASEWYLERLAELSEPGDFDAWITGTDRPPNPQCGVSAAAWEIWQDNGTSPVSRNVAVSEAAYSCEYRAFVAAAVGVAETLAPNSKVVIRGRNEAVVNGINEWADGWRHNNWRGSTRKIVKAKEIWERLLEVRDTRNLKIAAVHIRKSDETHSKIIDRLAIRAREAGDAHKKTLGIGEGGFGVVKGGFVSARPTRNGRRPRR